jgi:hypothetical protein
MDKRQPVLRRPVSAFALKPVRSYLDITDKLATNAKEFGLKIK